MNEKQRRFVAEYLKDLNATQAAIRAGYAAKWADGNAVRLTGNKGIAAAIQAGQAKRLAKLEITADRVLEEVARVAFSDIRLWFDDDGHLRPITALPTDVAAALGSIEVLKEKTRTDNGVTVEESVVKVKAWDKMRALELLSKHLGLVKEQHEHSGKGGAPIETRVVFGGRYRPAADGAGG